MRIRFVELKTGSADRARCLNADAGLCGSSALACSHRWPIGLIKIRPISTIDDAVDCTWMDTELCGNRLDGASFFASETVRLPRLRFVQLRCAMSFTARLIESAFLDTIAHVVRLCAEKQMIRVATRRIVAMMANHQAMNALPSEVFIGNAATPVLPPADMDKTVASFIPATSPQPAAIRIARAIHAAQETINSFVGYIGHVILLTGCPRLGCYQHREAFHCAQFYPTYRLIAGKAG